MAYLFLPPALQPTESNDKADGTLSQVKNLRLQLSFYLLFFAGVRIGRQDG